eukprot:scaffold10022_cov170-Amphora_coffeaeformis.AAC.8
MDVSMSRIYFIYYNVNLLIKLAEGLLFPATLQSGLVHSGIRRGTHIITSTSLFVNDFDK